MHTYSFHRRMRLPAAAIAIFALLVPVALAQTLPKAQRPQSAASSATQSVPRFTVSDLGLLPSLADDVSVSLNAAGQVSLWVEAPGETVQAALWSHGQVRRLGSLPGCPNSVPRGINDSGEIVGWANTSANVVDSLSTTRAFVYRQGQFRPLGTLGGRDSRAAAINAAGKIVGVSDVAGGGRHAFLFNGRTLTDLGTLPGGKFSQAYALNSLGHAVGVSDSDRPFLRAVLWRGGQTVDLGTLPGGSTSSAQAINDRDQVAGYADTPDGPHAFLYADGRMQDLGTLGNDPSRACSLNSKGQIVGASSGPHFDSHAFLWQNKRMIDLNSLTHTDPRVNTDWVLTVACGINERGQIVCLGQHKGSASEAAHVLLLTPIG